MTAGTTLGVWGVGDPGLTEMLAEAEAQFMLAKQRGCSASSSNSLTLPQLRFVAPMLPTLVSEAPPSDHWLHEIKYDGFRTQLTIHKAGVTAFTRNGHDWSRRYTPITSAAAELKCSSAIIDGEVIVQDEEGRSDFEALKRAFPSQPQMFVFMAFDLLYLNGRDLRAEPLLARKAILGGLVGCHDPSCRIQYVEHLIGGGGAVFEAADRLGLEGIVSKRVHSRYSSGRSKNWLKVKCWTRGEFLVLAVERPQDGPAMALLAEEIDEGLFAAGWAAVTLESSERGFFWREVDRLTCTHARLPLPLGRDVQPLRAGLRVEAQYLKGAQKLRHATLTAVRSKGT